MQRPLALSIAVCLGLTSCQVFEKSEIWNSVIHVTPGDAIRDPDPSAAYAAKLHRVLLEEGAEHIVVTYQYHYYTHQRDEAVGTRTAIVYRDPSTPTYPWWLKDDRTATPVWLPNGDLAHQISFYIHRPAEVLEKKEYHARGGSGKATLGMFRPAAAKPRPLFADHSQHAITKIAQMKSAPPVAAKPASIRPNPYTAPTTPTAMTKIQRPAKVAEAKPKPVSEAPASVASGPRPNTLWAPPVTLIPAAPVDESAPRSAHLEKLFRAKNGTNYDRTSSMDRRKMEQLKHGLVSEETSGENGFRRGADGFEELR